MNVVFMHKCSPGPIGMLKVRFPSFYTVLETLDRKSLFLYLNCVSVYAYILWLHLLCLSSGRVFNNCKTKIEDLTCENILK